jgi:hypothetical protein
MRHYCVYFDHRYLPRALLMIRSLQARSANGAHVWVLCLNDEVFRALSVLDPPDVTLIPISELEEVDPELAATRRTRSLVEYYFTCSPALPLHVFRRAPELDLVTYVDADLYFYSDPEPLFEELGDRSVAIVAHRFSPRLRPRVKFGIYNVAWLTFRSDPAGMSVLNWWREKCIEWCYDVLQEDRYADQKYLDDWPARFSGVVVLDHPGANVAPWNVDNHALALSDHPMTSDGAPLLFFHFQGVKQVVGHAFDVNLSDYHVHRRRALTAALYGPYIAEMRKTADEVRGLVTTPTDNIRRAAPTGVLPQIRALAAIAWRLSRGSIIWVR